jgi:hypothetical protein
MRRAFIGSLHPETGRFRLSELHPKREAVLLDQSDPRVVEFERRNRAAQVGTRPPPALPIPQVLANAIPPLPDQFPDLDLDLIDDGMGDLDWEPFIETHNNNLSFGGFGSRS